MRRPETPISDQPYATPAGRRQLDALLVSIDPLWPLDRPHSAVGCRVIRALSRRGRRVALASARPTPPSAQAWVTEKSLRWPKPSADHVRQLLRQWSGPGKDARFLAASRLGVRPADLAGVVSLIQTHQPRVVIATGVGGPALLSGVRAADRTITTVWLGHEREAVAGLLELLDSPWRAKPAAALSLAAGVAAPLAFTRCIDHVAATSRTDAALLAGLTLSPCAIRVPRGINRTRFAPDPQPVRPATAVTWAPDLAEPRLAAGIERFARRVWPRLLTYFPDARWHLIGPDAPPRLRDLEAIDGIKIVAQVADLRTYAQRCRVALWPGRSLPAQGKPVLQAMAMGMPCVTSLLAARQLGVPLRSRRTTGPLAACVGRQAWFERIAQLWTVPDAASAMGAAARNWAVDHADWQRNTDALDALIEHAKRHDRHERVTESPDIASSAETEPTNLPISFRTAVAEDRPQPPLRKAA